MAGRALARGHGAMGRGLQQPRTARTMGGMAAYTGATGNMAKMGGDGGFGVTPVTGHTQSIGLLNQQLGLAGIMGIMTGGTAILQRRMDILAFKFLPVVTLVAGLVHRLLQEVILGSIMTGMAFPALPLLDRLMDRDITHARGQLPVTAEAEARGVLAQKNTTDDAMGKMAGSAGVIRHRLMNFTLFKSRGHVGMAILAALAYGLAGLVLHTGCQTADQK